MITTSPICSFFLPIEKSMHAISMHQLHSTTQQWQTWAKYMTKWMMYTLNLAQKSLLIQRLQVMDGHCCTNPISKNFDCRKSNPTRSQQCASASSHISPAVIRVGNARISRILSLSERWIEVSRVRITQNHSWEMIVLVYNFRASTVGLNQTQTTFMPHLERNANTFIAR